MIPPDRCQAGWHAAVQARTFGQRSWTLEDRLATLQRRLDECAPDSRSAAVLRTMIAETLDDMKRRDIFWIAEPYSESAIRDNGVDGMQRKVILLQLRTVPVTIVCCD